MLDFLYKACCIGRGYNRNSFFKIPTLVFLLVSSLPAIAQEMLVEGTVREESGDPLPGVNITVKGISSGTITDVDGRFSLEVPDPQSILVFSFIGFQTQEVPINNRGNLDVQLITDVKTLSEVVVIGYGTVRKSDLTGSVSSVKGDELVKVPSVNPMQALQGKVAGVQVVSSTGAPGANPVVRIRGAGSIHSNAPIYVVDGVILNDIAFLNAADIESMEVLKDASATSIYGSRGANGVIMITTKKGKLGQEPVYSYSGEYSVQKVTQTIDLLNGPEFATIYNEITPGTFNNISALPDTDWQDLIFQSAPIHNHQVSVTGATEKTQYYIGVGYFNQKGIIDKSNYERISIKLNNTYHFSDHVRFGNNITLSPYKQQNAPNVTSIAYRATPIEAAYLSNGDFAGVNAVGNPLASLAYSNDFNKGFRSVGNFFAEIDFLKNFTFRSSYGIDFLYNKFENFSPAYTIYFPSGQPSNQQNIYSSLNKGNTDNFNWLWENTLNFSKELNRHRIDVVVGYTMQESASEEVRLQGQNLLRDSEDFWYIRPEYIYDESTNINNISNIENKVDNNLYYSMISYLARANYTFDDRYIFTATFRRDGSSKFTEGNRYAQFPSLAFGWNISNEAFMPEISFLSNLKLRASWGKVGNDKIPYTSQFSEIQSGLFAVLGAEQAAIPGATFGITGNPDLVWETSTQADIGLEFGLWKNKLTAEIDYYRKVTDDILIPLSTPGYFGNGVGAKRFVNAASILNRGFEVNLVWRDEPNNNFSYSIGATGSSLYNEVLTIGGSAGVDSTLVGGPLDNGSNVTLSREGHPLGSFYGYKTDGIFQNQSELDYPHLSSAGVGDLRFVDTNGDGLLTADDRTSIGSPFPDFIFGLNFQATYKNLDLSMDLQGQVGNEILNGKEIVRPDPYNFEQKMMDRWTGEGTSNTVPKPSFGGYNYNVSDYFVQDGSFVRLRNITLGYNLPKTLLSTVKINQARVFARATNLITWTRYTGYSPEVSHAASIGREQELSFGIDKGTYPVATIYSIGLNINF